MWQTTDHAMEKWVGIHEQSTSKNCVYARNWRTLQRLPGRLWRRWTSASTSMSSSLSQRLHRALAAARTYRACTSINNVTYFLLFARLGILEDYPQLSRTGRGQKIVALASKTTGIGIGLSLASTPWFLLTCNECTLCNETKTVLTFLFWLLWLVWNIETMFVRAFVWRITVGVRLVWLLTRSMTLSCLLYLLHLWPWP